MPIELSTPSENPIERTEREAIIALSFAPGIGSARLRTLLAHFDSAVNVLNSTFSGLMEVEGIGEQIARSIAALDVDSMVREQLDRAERSGATLVTILDENYPEFLRQIHDPPVSLWVQGGFESNDRHSVAIVGTRRPTDEGIRVARKFARELTTAGYTIVSGLAYGIDAAAHRGALEAGGRTIAVLGSGVDRIYPASHRSLAEQIRSFGAVISEFALGTAPDAPNFPKRNRVISGLALGTLVVEARQTGGALLTAHLALEQNREVFAVPGSVFSPASEGTNNLIAKSGAKLVQSVDDVLAELPSLDREGAISGSMRERHIPDNLPESEQKILLELGSDAVHIDSLCRSLQMESADALVYLLNLEFSGLVGQLPGKRFYRR